MNKIKIAIIGCGRISGWHCRAIQDVKGVYLVSVCDLDKAKCKSYGDQFNVPYFTNYREMLNNHPEIDVVAIVTPSGMHFEHAVEIISKFRKHIIVEKPTFMTPSQVEKAYEIAKKYRKKIFPVFQNRFNTAVQRVKKAIQKKEIGEIRIVSVRVRWCRPQRYYEMSPWRGTFSHDGGALTNQGIHHIDLLRYLCGEIDEVNCKMSALGAKIKVEDSVIAIFKYKNGAMGNLEVTTAARPDDYEASISIVGSKGLVQLGGVAVNMLEVFTPNPKECMKYSDDFTKLPDRGRVYGKGHIDLYKSVANDLNNKKRFYVTKDDCLASIKLLHSFYLSDEKSSWVKLNKKIKSKRLGRPNEKLSQLYRI